MPPKKPRALPRSPRTADARPGARTLNLRPGDTLATVRQVRAGFPFRDVEKFQETIDLPTEQFARLISVPARTFTRRKRSGRFQPDESDRVLRACRVFDLAVGLFEGNTGAARAWLASPQTGLGGTTPLDLASTEVGAREVEDLIGRLEYGVVA